MEACGKVYNEMTSVYSVDWDGSGTYPEQETVQSNLPRIMNIIVPAWPGAERENWTDAYRILLKGRGTPWFEGPHPNWNERITWKDAPALVKGHELPEKLTVLDILQDVFCGNWAIMCQRCKLVTEDIRGISPGDLSLTPWRALHLCNTENGPGTYVPPHELRSILGWTDTDAKNLGLPVPLPHNAEEDKTWLVGCMLLC